MDSTGPLRERPYAQHARRGGAQLGDPGGVHHREWPPGARVRQHDQPVDVGDAERLVARIARHPLEPDRVGVREVRGHGVDEGVVARVHADLRRHLHVARALGAEGAVEDLDHLGAGQADGLHVGAAEVADALAGHGRGAYWGQTAHMRALFSLHPRGGALQPARPVRARVRARGARAAVRRAAGSGRTGGRRPASSSGSSTRHPRTSSARSGPACRSCLPRRRTRWWWGRSSAGSTPTAALPRLRAAFEEWRPDVVLRDPNEYGSALAAELHGIPHARVAIGLASTEELGLGIAAGAVDAIRRAEGLAPDPDADRLRRAPYLSLFPPTLDEGAQPDTQRFHDPAWDEPPGELPDWWPGREGEPLVYVTFGSVAGSFPAGAAGVRRGDAGRGRAAGAGAAHGRTRARPRRAAARARERARRALGAAAGRARPRRRRLVHGGSGSTLGALAAGVPLVVMPLFADQPQNARRVAEVGAGLAVEPNREDLDATVSPAARGHTTASSASRPTASARGRWPTSCAHCPWSTTRFPWSKAPRAAKLNCLATDPLQNEPVPASGQVWLLADNPREPEIVFDFPFHEDLNEAVKELPRRWFDWRRKHWRVPAHPRVAKAVEALLAQFPDLVPSPEVLAWLSDSDRWRAICTVVARDGRGHFLVRTLQGEQPAELEGATEAGEGRVLLPFAAESAVLVQQLDGLRLDDLARMCARELRDGRSAGAGRADGPDGRGRRAPPHALPRLGPHARRPTSRSSPSRTRCTGRGASSCATPPGAWPCRPTRPWRRSSPSSSRRTRTCSWRSRRRS